MLASDILLAKPIALIGNARAENTPGTTPPLNARGIHDNDVRDVGMRRIDDRAPEIGMKIRLHNQAVVEASCIHCQFVMHGDNTSAELPDTVVEWR